MTGDKVGKHYRYCSCIHCVGPSGSNRRRFCKRNKRKAIRREGKKEIRVEE